MSNTIGKEFMRKTQYNFMGESDQEKGIKQPPIELAYDEAKLIPLPNPKEFKVRDVDFKALVEQRHSLRKYSEEALSLEELAYLLWCTQGIKKMIKREGPNGPNEVTFRTVPSAGARHPYETYLLINNVDGLKPGIYRYIATKQQLLEVSLKDDIADEVVEASYNQIFIKTAAVTFIWVVDIQRTKWRYDERSYRYVLLDAGHICQNLYLAAETIDSGVCAIAAYNDEALNSLLGLDGENQFVTYLSSLGKKISIT